MRKILLYYAYLFLVWGFYRYATHFSEVVDEFVAKPVIWLLPIAFIIVFFEKKNVIHGIHLHFRTVFHDVVIGIVGALFVLGIFWISVYVRDGNIIFNPHHFSLSAVPLLLWVAFATALIEEITFRGFIFSRLRRARHYVHWANILTTFLFVLIHLPIVFLVQHATPVAAFTQLLLLAELSLIDGYLFHARSGLIAPLVSHMVWDFTILWMI